MSGGGIEVGADACAVTVVTDDFIYGAVVAIGSFLEQHADRDEPILVLFDPDRVPLSERNRERLEALSPRVRCVQASDPGFWAARDVLAGKIGTPPRLAAAFLILEAFRFRGVRRVVAVDSDLLFLRRCDDLFDTDVDFGAVRAFDADGHLPRGFFNSGVTTIGPRHLTGVTYSDLMHSTSLHHMDRRVGKADQAVLNSYFSHGRVTYLDPSLNVAKRHYPDEAGPLRDQLERLPARVLHYVGEKPWTDKVDPSEERFTQVEALWDDALARIDPESYVEYRESRGWTGAAVPS